MNQAMNWLFTINNPTDNNEDDPQHWKGVKYCIWQHEKGENGTLHVQGYIRLEKKQRLSGLKKLNPRAHWEVRRGTHAQAKAYCSKSETRVAGPWTIGDDDDGSEPQPGRRTDLDTVKRKIDEGSSLASIYDEHFSSACRYYKFFQEYKRLKTSVRDWYTDVEVLIGKTATGKTQRTKLKYPGAYWKSNDKWWDDYDGHAVVILDEFEGWLTYRQLLRLMDNTPLQVEVKGGKVQFLAKKLVIISNHHPADWYKEPYQDSPLERRIKDNIEYTSFVEPIKVHIPNNNNNKITGY